jgi:hypothetical protein
MNRTTFGSLREGMPPTGDPVEVRQGGPAGSVEMPPRNQTYPTLTTEPLIWPQMAVCLLILVLRTTGNLVCGAKEPLQEEIDPSTDSIHLIQL